MVRSHFAILALGFFLAADTIAADSIVYNSEQQALDYMALSYASTNGHLVLVEGLLARGTPVDPPRRLPEAFTSAEYLAMQFVTPLQAASQAGHLDVVLALLKRRPNLEWQCCASGTALYLAASNGHLEIVKALLEAGANVEGDPSPLDGAKTAGHPEIVSILAAWIEESE